MHYRARGEPIPTLKRFGFISIRLYAGDHRPPHFHVVSPDFEVVVSLSDFSIVAGEARERDLVEALNWARTNRDFLIGKWAELNERG